MKRKKLTIFLLFLLGFTLAFAQESSPLKVSADKLIFRQKDNLLYLEGKVKILFQNYTLTGEKARLNLQSKEGEVTGRVTLFDSETRVSAEELKIFYQQKQLFFKRKVNLETSKQLLQAKNQPPVKTFLQCESLEYDWGKQKGEAGGGVTVISGGKNIYAQNILYQGATQQVLLKGKVKMERKPDEFFLCDELLLNLKDQSAQAKGEVKGNLLLFLEKEKTGKPGSLPLKLEEPENQRGVEPEAPAAPGEKK